VSVQTREEGRYATHGAMITRAPGIGRGFPSMDEGTCDSHPSSSFERVEERAEYHDPAWLASLVVMLGARQALDKAVS
jgi:hypothetical protein